MPLKNRMASLTSSAKAVVFVYVFASIEGFCFHDNPGCADIIPTPTDQSIPGNHEMHHPH